ncbi:hypothetical protein SRHO_G00218860 [Serrasalmus rhombeus]
MIMMMVFTSSEDEDSSHFTFQRLFDVRRLTIDVLVLSTDVIFFASIQANEEPQVLQVTSPSPSPPPLSHNPEELKELRCPDERQLEGGRIPVHATFTACCLSLPAKQTSPAADAAKISALALSTAPTTDLTGRSTSNLSLPNALAEGGLGYKKETQH